jgi:transposase-like protein
MWKAMRVVGNNNSRKCPCASALSPTGPITRKTAERHLVTWIRRAVNVRGHFPTETAALKCVYLAIISLDPTGRGRQRWSNRWKEALNAFEIIFDGRLPTNRK